MYLHTLRGQQVSEAVCSAEAAPPSHIYLWSTFSATRPGQLRVINHIFTAPLIKGQQTTLSNMHSVAEPKTSYIFYRDGILISCRKEFLPEPYLSLHRQNAKVNGISTCFGERLSAGNFILDLLPLLQNCQLKYLSLTLWKQTKAAINR